MRPATIADWELLRQWDEQEHVIASNPNDDWAWEVELGRFPEWRSSWSPKRTGGRLASSDNRPEAEKSHYWGNVSANLSAIDIWIGREADLGRGYGTKMMKLALARCFDEASVSAVLADPLASNTRAHRFYARFGFRFLERRRFGDDECCVYRLDRSETRRRPTHPCGGAPQLAAPEPEALFIGTHTGKDDSWNFRRTIDERRK